jgi:hypothetical protein
MTETVVRFQIDRNAVLKSISTEEYEAMEMAQDGDAKIYRLRPVLARFMVGEDGNLLEHGRAMRQLAKLPFEEFMRDVFPAFFKALQSAAVNPTSGDSLQPLSEANMQASPSLDG